MSVHRCSDECARLKAIWDPTKPLTWDKLMCLGRYIFQYQRELGVEQDFIDNPDVETLLLDRHPSEIIEMWNRMVIQDHAQRMKHSVKKQEPSPFIRLVASLFPCCMPQRR